MFNLAVAGTPMFLSGIRDAIGLGGTLRNGSCNAYENKA
jgi:hypothetical protein